jgi:hypothetical protein
MRKRWSQKPHQPFNVLKFKQACRARPCGPPGAQILFRAWHRDKIARLTAFLVPHKHFQAPIGRHYIPLPQGGVAPGTLYRFLFQIVRRERVSLPTARVCDEVIAPTARLVYPLVPLFSRQIRVSSICRLLPWATGRRCEKANEKQSCDRNIHLQLRG